MPTTVTFDGVLFPLIRRTKVYHVGTMNPADKGRQSYEGHGLSVSTCPAEWEAIARLGGNPWWLLANSDGSFLDFHSVRKSEPLMGAVTAWCRAEGLVADAGLYDVEYEEGELGGDRMTFADRAKAEHEDDGLGEVQ